MQRAGRKHLGIVVGMVLAIGVVVLIAAGGSAKKGPPKSHGPQVHGSRAEVAWLLAGIPQHGSTLGYPTARVKVEYFGDLQCPFCRRFTLGALHSLIVRYVRDGRLAIEYRSLQTATRNPETFTVQQTAALAAGKQDKMWNFIELFYHEQGEENSGYVTESYLQGLAQQVPGLNLIGWTAARSDPAFVKALTADARYALAAGIRQTPSFLIGTRGSVPYAAAIKKLLRG